MADIKNLTRQHGDIDLLIGNIKNLSKGNIESSIDIIVKDINMLAGKLKIHLDTEDKFLYPDLLNMNNEVLNTMAKEYMKEMGNISSEFIKYKNNFNTKNKIISNVEQFKIQTVEVFEILERRINKEERELYPRLK
jgi:hemerythrin-like domain-containing protein